MKQFRAILALCLLCSLTSRASTGSFDFTAPPAGWEVVKGKAAAAGGIAPEGRAALVMRSASIDQLPVEAVFRVRVGGRGWSRFEITGEGEEKPLLSVGLLAGGNTRLRISAQASGEKMATTAISSRGYGSRSKPNGSVSYEWRFPAVKNLWDDRDRNEIGDAYGKMRSFKDKLVALRLIVTPSTRQVWVDDRLVAEARTDWQGTVRLRMSLPPGCAVQVVEIGTPEESDGFIPLHLDDYSADGSRHDAGVISCIEMTRRVTVPMRMPGRPGTGVDLGESLFRYRLAEGPGPDVGYVNGNAAYPNPFRVDPAVAAFRVPYRDYRNVWLLVWLDNEENSVPRGSLRFYRDKAGHDARTDFEISDETVAAGLVKPLRQMTADGKQLYLVRVPVNTEALYGFEDMHDQFLDLQITKPVYLLRSYPDPIYYGYQPGGLPSSIHVVGITLEEGSFGYHVEPEQYGHVFEQPETPTETVTVRNNTDKPIRARVELMTKSYDGTEETRGTGKVKVPARGSVSTQIMLNKIERLGWHEMKIQVSVGDEVRGNTLSLILLPKNQRTYGYAPNETRFGAWNLLGHYTPFSGDREKNERVLAMMRRLGIRRNTSHRGFFDVEMLKRHDYLPTGPHTIVGYYHRLDVEDPKQMQTFLAAESKQVASARTNFPTTTYFYGGEWNYDHHYSYAPDPRYTGGKPHELDEKALANMNRQMVMFKAVGKKYRKEAPSTTLILQWGAPMNTIGFLANGFPQDLVDGYGMDAPMFELTPEVPWLTGCMNQLWLVRQEIARLKRPQLPISWCEGPFLPTNEGALSEREQEENHVRYWLMGLAYGVENFEAGIVPSDAGNYYGAEHYGAGVFRRVPLECPKPAAAALATATAKLCGVDVVGPVDTGVLTTYAMAFRRSATGASSYAIWRVVGTVNATISVNGSGPATVTDSMGNVVEQPIVKGKILVQISPSPVWLAGVDGITGFKFDSPVYEEAPSEVTHTLPVFSSANWRYDGGKVGSYENNHFAMARGIDPQLTATFDGVDPEHSQSAAITLAKQPAGDRPLLIRYGAIVLKKPAPIPGRATALGVWMKGNSGWGRIAYQVRDARGELWTSIGTKNDWNCDDTFTWSYAKHEGWRYVRFPLPANRPYDSARYLESTWWGHEGGDGIVDLPLKLEKIFVTARNEVQYLGEMKVVPDRAYVLAGLVAEYESADDMSADVVSQHRIRKSVPRWHGPQASPIVRMRKENGGGAPTIKKFSEPLHFNDGRRMVVRFDQKDGWKYELYLSRYRDGRGADKLRGYYKDNQEVRGFRPGIKMYLFLVATDSDGKASKPSAPYELITEDKFREK